jgi:hypothetical protein
MSRSHTVLLEALLTLAVTVGAQCRSEPVGAHLAGSDALRCARGHGAAVGVVGAHTRRGGGSFSRPPSCRPAARRRGPVQGQPTGVGGPGRSFVAAVELAVVQARQRGGSGRRNPSRPGWIRPAATRSTGADAGWRGLHFRSPSLAILLLIGVRAAPDGADLASATGVETAPQPTKATTVGMVGGGSGRAWGVGRPCQSGVIHPHWRGRAAGLASKAAVSGDRLGTAWGHPARVVQKGRVFTKWAIALLPIAKVDNP